ncbi:hypothetical protein [Oceanobacillus sp. CFH 90083]|uniref:hypothetical protein n=1 Tax=Oceanobacillus sp. CFH 90083 TaxID=2592336 RepID=UPI00128C7374|nr:hypothetical protein [Oceanobacillus sp. CFH 90083]
MKIEVNVQAPELVEAVNNLAAAMGSAPVVEAPAKKEEPAKKVEAKEDKKQEKKEEPKTFSRASYYYHEESDSYLAFKKGDEIPTEPGFTDAKSISKKEYDKGIAEQEAPDEKEDSVPTVEEVRAKTAETSKAGKRDEVKDLLAEFGVTAISKIPEDQRADFIEKLDEL